MRGEGADFVIGDVLERFADDIDAGGPRWRARVRFRVHVLTTCLAWWAPRASQARRTAAGQVTGSVRRAGWTNDPGGPLREVVVAARTLMRRPGFAIGVVCTLGLGIAATTTIFSVVDGVLFRPLPYEDPSALVAVGTVFPTRVWDDEGAGRQHLAGISLLNYADYAERNRSLEAVGAVESISVLFPDEGAGPELAPAARASLDFFPLLGVGPVLGRGFTAADFVAGAEPVVLLSHGAWTRRFGGRPEVVGASLGSTGAGGTIVGVLPADFVPPEASLSTRPEVWMPLIEHHPRYASRGMRSLGVVGRLAPGATEESARLEADAIADQLAIDFPDGNVYPDGSYFGIGVNLLSRQTIGGAGTTLRLFMGAAVLLLLLASVNATTLFLARALDRVGEMDVRRALGAGRVRVVRLLLFEAGLLAILSGVVGVALAVVGVEAFLRFAPSDLPRLQEVRVDGRAAAMAAVVSLGTGLLAGLVPAFRSGSPARPGGAGRGRVSSLHSARIRTGMVGAQIGLAMLLLSGAGLLVKSFHGMVTESPGFEPDGLVSMTMSLKRPGAPEVEAWQDWDLALAELSEVGGVTSVAGTSNPPFQSPSWAPRILLPEDPPEAWRDGITGYVITSGYLETLGAELSAGRGFSRLDGPDSERVALVNESFVRMHLGGDEVLGLVIRRVDGETAVATRVVGVVPDMVQTSVDEGRRAAVYFPYTQVDWPFVHTVVRSDLPEASLVPELRKAIARFSPAVPPRDVRTMRARISSSRTQPRFHAALIGTFAVVAMLIAALGLHASLTHAIGRRERELGVRMVLGADRSRVAGLVVRQGLTAAALGLVIGLIGSVWTGRLLTGFLHEVTPYDPVTIGGVALLLLTVVFTACVAPARRASSVDPSEALRSE